MLSPIFFRVSTSTVSLYPVCVNIMHRKAKKKSICALRNICFTNNFDHFSISFGNMGFQLIGTAELDKKNGQRIEITIQPNCFRCHIETMGSLFKTIFNLAVYRCLQFFIGIFVHTNFHCAKMSPTN